MWLGGEGGWRGGGVRSGDGRTGRDGVDVRQDRAAGFSREKFRKTYLLGSCIQVHAKRPPKLFYVFSTFYIYTHKICSSPSP